MPAAPARALPRRDGFRLSANASPQHGADRGRDFGLAQRFGADKFVGGAAMAVLRQHQSGGLGDIVQVHEA